MVQNIVHLKGLIIEFNHYNILLNRSPIYVNVNELVRGRKLTSFVYTVGRLDVNNEIIFVSGRPLYRYSIRVVRSISRSYFGNRNTK